MASLTHLLENNPTEFRNYVCPRCDLLLRDAVQQMCCGHWVCEWCAKEISRERSPCCPRQDCRELWSDDGYFPDRFVRKTLNKIPVMCINAECDWKGYFEELCQHLKECKQQCKSCKQWIKRTEMKYHRGVCLGALVKLIQGEDGDNFCRLSLTRNFDGTRTWQRMADVQSKFVNEPFYAAQYEQYSKQLSQCVTGFEDDLYPDDPTSDLSYLVTNSCRYLMASEPTKSLQHQIALLQNCKADEEMNAPISCPHVPDSSVLPLSVLNIVSNRCFVWKLPIVPDFTRSALADTPYRLCSRPLCPKYNVYLQATLKESSSGPLMFVCMQGDCSMTDRFSAMINLRLLNLKSGECALPTTQSSENPLGTGAVHSYFTSQQLSDPAYIHNGAIYIAALLEINDLT